MRKYGMDADAGLLGLNLVDGVFRFVALFTDGEDTKRGDGFKRIVGLWMLHANVNGNKVSHIKEG